jgi:hypothetical protein
MAVQTGENEQALRKILDMTRLISIVILVIHFYYYCYAAFQEWGLISTFSDRIKLPLLISLPAYCFIFRAICP